MKSAVEQECVQEQYDYFPVEEGRPGGIRIYEKVPVVKGDRPKAFRERGKDDFTGWTVWASSIVASRWAASHSAEFSGRDVLELGSGCGLAGLVVAAHCNPRSVHLTDYNAGTVGNLSVNVAANCAPAGAGDGLSFTTSLGAPVRVHQMDWDEPGTWPADSEGVPLVFDTVVGADLLYRRSYARKLGAVLDGVLRPGGTFLCTTPAQREGLPLLLRLLAERGYEVEEIEVGPEWRGNPLAPGSLGLLSTGAVEGATGGGAGRTGLGVDSGSGVIAPASAGEGAGSTVASQQVSSAAAPAEGELESTQTGAQAVPAAPTDGLFPELYMRAYPLLAIRCVRPTAG